MTVVPMTPPPHKLTEAEAEALTHDSYLMQIREQSCANCQCGEKWGELYEVWTSPQNMRKSSAYVLRPASVLRSGIPLSYTALPIKEVPVCSECVATYNPAAGGAIIPASSHSAWLDTLRRKYAPEPKPTTSTSRPEPRLDQL